MAPRKIVKSLLDLEAVQTAIEEAGVDKAKAEGHARRIVQAAFRHERFKVHRELVKAHAEKEAAGNDSRSPLERCNQRVEREFSVDMVDNLPRGVGEALRDWRVLTTRVVHVSESTDYVTTKLLIELESGHQVEAVILRHNKRTTLCVSSQVGCKMACTFCATGTLGQRANMTSGEIQEEMVHANRFLQGAREPRIVSNVVFMGMGEPLNNYNSLVAACRGMTDTARFALSPGKVTVSTVGVINRMLSLQNDVPGVSLALSLHAPNQELRQTIIPTAGAYPLPKLMDAVRHYLSTKQADSSRDAFVMIEYILLSGVNDMPHIAHELAELLDPIKAQVKVNLIPYNPIFNAEGLAKTFRAPTQEDVDEFQRIIQTEHGIFCTTRTEMGQDVNGACGQLACVAEEAKGGGVDIEDLYRNRQDNKLYDAETGENVKKKRKLRLRRAADEASAAARAKRLAVGGGVLAFGVLAVVALWYTRRPPTVQSASQSAV